MKKQTLAPVRRRNLGSSTLEPMFLAAFLFLIPQLARAQGGVVRSTKNSVQVALLHLDKASHPTAVAMRLYPAALAFDGADIWVTNDGSNIETKLWASDGSTLRIPDGLAFDGDNLGNATTACSYIFKSGTSWNTSQFCVTVNGNITEFSRPSGVEYLGRTSAGEGYGICDMTFSGVSYFDYARKDNSSFGPSTLVSRTASAVKIARTTNDGFWTLVQTITHLKATPQSPASAVIRMSLSNNTINDREVTLIRYADINANGTKVNDFDYTLDTAYGLQPNPLVGPGPLGLASTNNTFILFPTRNWNALAQNVPTGPDPCNYGANTAAQPFIGDGSVLQAWGLFVKSGATITVTMTYKPI